MGNAQSQNPKVLNLRLRKSLSLRRNRRTDTHGQHDLHSSLSSEKSSDVNTSATELAATFDTGSRGDEGARSDPSYSQNKLLRIVENGSSDDSESDNILSALDRLLMQQKSDRLKELQVIQQNNKLVSDGKNCRKLDRFFARTLGGDLHSETTSTSSEERNDYQQSSNQGAESVVLEVRGLFQSQPVTSLLERDNFKIRLENIIRGNLIRQEHEMETALRLRHTGPLERSASVRTLTESPVAIRPRDRSGDLNSTNTNVRQNGQHFHIAQLPHQPSPDHNLLDDSSSEVSSHSGSLSGVHPPPPIPPPPPPPPPGMVYQYMPIPLQYQPANAVPPIQPHPQLSQPRPQLQLEQFEPEQRSSSQQHRLQSPQPTRTTSNAISQQPTRNVISQRPTRSTGGVAPQQPWLLYRPQRNSNDQENDIQVAQREAFISEISELVHSQLVTSTLESNFRGQLEVMMQRRMTEIDTDGEQIMNYVQNLPRSENIVRNDFHHLGITSPNQAVGGTTQGQQQQGLVPTGAWFQEMSTLKQQMAELQNMVKISFDLQLDLQRAIRQEVSAALHSAHGNPPTACAAQAGQNDPANEGHCIICLDKSIDSVLYQCGHMCVCLACGLRLKDLNSHCPLCRAPIRDVIRAFKCHEK